MCIAILDELVDDIDQITDVVRGFMLDKPIKRTAGTENARMGEIGEFGENSGGIIELNF